MRAHLYPIPADLYGDLEGQILESLRDGERDQLSYLVSENLGEVELLSAEWRSLVAAAEDFVSFVDLEERRARMAVSPDEIALFAGRVHDPDLVQRWRPISFGLSTIRHNLDATTGAPVGLVMIEEADDWLWVESTHEMMAIRPEVWALLEPHIRALAEAGDHAALARLAGDHCEGAVEFSPQRWDTLLEQAQHHAPGFRKIVTGMFSPPEDYPRVLEAMTLVSDPQYQPSLDSWLRVHSRDAQYGLYFRDLASERG